MAKENIVVAVIAIVLATWMGCLSYIIGSSLSDLAECQRAINAAEWDRLATLAEEVYVH